MLSWTCLARWGSLPIPLLVMTFEVALCGSTIATLVCLGYHPTPIQGLGLFISILGLALLARGH